MTKTVSFRVDDEEERILLSEMLATGDETIAAHVKRVYFASVSGLPVKTSSSLLEDIFINVRYLREKENAKPDDSLMLQVLCGLYIMLRNSVSDSVKKEADELIDVQEIQNFLKG